jgi:uncharacterized phage protein gp47/JayE
MAVIAQTDIANQLMRQLRILDPSVSVDIGTPERKILDTVAQGIADAQIDVSALESALDIDSKVGDDLDAFLSIFNFARQKGSAAIGIVEFSRSIASTLDITIPTGTQVSAQASDGSAAAIFSTTQTVILTAGQLAVDAPVQSIAVGNFNNVAANTITLFVSSPVQGITGVTNPTPTTGGLDIESDAQLRLRFKNTVFRNLAGTSDQFLALAVAGAFTTKANVIGPISRYREYIQVPNHDDSNANGDASEYTTALSTNPYAKYVYTTTPNFISNGETGIDTIFWTEGLDFRVNTTAVAKNAGDTYREAHAGPPTGLDPLTDDGADFQPNVTFLNIYTGADTTVEALHVTDVALFEYSYVSSASRNDYPHAVLNCVDVYINNANPLPATTVIPKPTTASVPFQDNPTHRYHYDNYRRVGEPDHRPQLGNFFTPLFWTPVESLPPTITVGSKTYQNGVHYWPVIDVSSSGGSVRARTGIEWSSTILIDGTNIVNNTATSAQVTNYTFDKNVIDLQSSLEGAKQVTTDVLVHKATTRYFKFDVTVMYSTGAPTTSVNLNISANVQSFLEDLYFGSFVQLSDILQVIHNTQGVDNVRWTADLDATVHRVTEATNLGAPRLGGVTDRVTIGTGTTQEIQSFYLTGDPTAGNYKLIDGTSGADLSDAIPFDADLSTIQPLVDTTVITIPDLLNVGIFDTANGTPAAPYFAVWVDNGQRNLLEVVSLSLDSDTVIFDADFAVRDNELVTIPSIAGRGDTVAGLKIRPRAQNTWLR